jgi:hypothetical protein
MNHTQYIKAIKIAALRILCECEKKIIGSLVFQAMLIAIDEIFQNNREVIVMLGSSLAYT